jgi:hypothetical protein
VGRTDQKVDPSLGSFMPGHSSAATMNMFKHDYDYHAQYAIHVGMFVGLQLRSGKRNAAFNAASMSHKGSASTREYVMV